MKIVSCFIVVLLALSCAGTKTKSFVLEFPPFPQLQTTLGLRLFQPETELNVARENRGSILSTLEKFEVIELNRSLYATLVKNKIFHNIKSLPAAAEGIQYKLLWMPRNYTVWAGGSQVKGVACVTYCFVNSKDQVVFQEEFSVAGESFHSSIASLKQKMNQAIVNRMLIRTLNIFHKKSGRQMEFPENYAEVCYYQDFDQAARILPDELLLVKLATNYRLQNSWKIQFGLDTKVSWQKFVDSM